MRLKHSSLAVGLMKNCYHCYFSSDPTLNKVRWTGTSWNTEVDALVPEFGLCMRQSRVGHAPSNLMDSVNLSIALR